ncbi:MAG: bifunctional aldolase/short-chain dehydrogenase [Terriglobia bacterium]|jgi:rhamnose utilization protein RhaD (predicted bifunctional aldolase and dehydrogenase)/NAD(P)-dependent dehydrogenase (short-subunit alcohol dehydrogenase family)
MENRWKDGEASQFIGRYAAQWGEDLALRAYASRLLGAEEALVLHGGGNTSVKGAHTNLLGEKIPAIYVKASGHNMAAIEPAGFPELDLEYLRKLRTLASLTDDAMIGEFRTHLLAADAPLPSVETLVHAFLPQRYIDHTHADAILTLTNQPDGEALVREALGDSVNVLPYYCPGFKLAKAVAAAFEAHPRARGMVWLKHGITTWGATAHESYQAMIELVSLAEAFIARRATKLLSVTSSTPLEAAQECAAKVAPVLRGLLAEKSDDPDRPLRRVILQSLITRQALDFVDSDRGRELALTPPLTSDHLIRTKAFPLWVDSPAYDDPARLREHLSKAVQDYSARYRAYVERYSAQIPEGLHRLDSLPRVVLLPGLGALCAGKDARAARIARDITAHTLAVKASVAAMGSYEGLPEDELFKMEYQPFQHAKLGPAAELPLARQVAIITGAAGAIGSAIAEELLANGCHAALTDLPGAALESLATDLEARYPAQVVAAPMDVTSPASVASAFDAAIRAWGGVDLVIVNAGIAMVSSLAEMKLEAFQKLERVNLEGTLTVLSEAARHFRLQGTGGDIVLVSTKNVFSPGPKFGAYSATKAGAHQLARIASLELAEFDVRVNMVAPDAIFSHGGRKSGLWAEVGPDRMRARGLDEKGLEEYYRQRNLLKATVTAGHVAKAVLFFATRQTPTTGATIPVDGGLPDATPR